MPTIEDVVAQLKAGASVAEAWVKFEPVHHADGLLLFASAVLVALVSDHRQAHCGHLFVGTSSVDQFILRVVHESEEQDGLRRLGSE
jgi:hypothetical protein